MRIVFAMVFLGCLCPTASANNPCELLDANDSGITNRSHGTIPYGSGQVSYDSRRELRGRGPTFTWAITENSSGYNIDAKWGSMSNDEEYLKKISVKNGIKSPRCRVTSSSRKPQNDSRLLKIRRRNISDWQENTVDTIFELTEQNSDGINLIDFILNIASIKAYAQNADERRRLIQYYGDGTLSDNLKRYVEVDTEGSEPVLILNTYELAQDEAALSEYFSLGFTSLSEFTVLVADLPTNADAMRQFSQGKEVSSDELTPMYFFASYGVTRRDSEIIPFYTLSSQILLDDISEKYSPEEFEKMSPSLSVETESAANEIFLTAAKSDPASLRVLSKPGDTNRIVLDGAPGKSFSTASTGILSIVDASNNIVPLLRIPLFISE